MEYKEIVVFERADQLFEFEFSQINPHSFRNKVSHIPSPDQNEQILSVAILQ